MPKWEVNIWYLIVSLHFEQFYEVAVMFQYNKHSVKNDISVIRIHNKSVKRMQLHNNNKSRNIGNTTTENNTQYKETIL